MDTFIFHTFVLMSIFNQINCRNIDSSSLNPFQNINNHITFILVIVLELVIQQSMVMTGSDKLSVISALLSTGKLTTVEHIVTYALALMVIPVGIAAKKVPDSAFTWAESINLEEPDHDDVVTQLHHRLADGI
jgi:hypothetical protein